MIIYFVFLVIISFFIYFLIILVIYSIFKIKKNNLKVIWPISVLRFCLPICCIGFFGQIALILTTLFNCTNGHAYISEYLPCREGSLFIYFSPFIFIAIFFHFILSLITNILYYKSLFIKDKSDILKKTNSIPDIIFLFTKIIIILVFAFDKEEENEHWYILFILLIITGFNAYINLKFSNRLNIILMILTIILSLILFAGFLTLFIGKIFSFLEFNGSIYLFLLGVIYIFFYIFLYKKKEIDFISIDYKNLNDANDYVNYILKFYRIILNKNNSRNNTTILKSYIDEIEENCIFNDCPLQKYLEKLENGVDSQYLLYQYLDKLFKYGKSKFKNNIMIKNAYAMFLISRMNDKRQATIVLKSIPKELISFSRNYIIYRCKKLLNNWPTQVNTYYYNYRNNANELRNLISKSTKYYYEFWTTLYESKAQNKDSFNNLFEIGSKIMGLNTKIEEIYNSIIKTKTNNIEIYKLFSSYIENILKDEEKFQYYQNIKNTLYNESFENEEKNYSNFNIELFKGNDTTNYLLVSGRKKDLGTIIDCSTSVCGIFGYTKEEIMGQNINIFIPDIFHIRHNIMLNHQTNNQKLKLFDDIFNKKISIPDKMTDNVFGVTKSKFIILLKLKVYFTKTEENIIAFVVEIIKDIPFMNELIKNRPINNNVDTRCCVLTNENFLINSFTSNSVEQLGLSYRFIKSNNSIIPYIKQLYEDYLNSINELNTNKNNYHSNSYIDLFSLDDSSRLSEVKLKININNISSDIKKKIKEDLINKKYNKKFQITWRINKKLYNNNNNNSLNKTIKNEENNNNNDSQTKCTRISQRGSSYNFSQIKKPEEKRFEIEFLMEIKKVTIEKKLLGYYFFFSKLYPHETKNFISYNSTDEDMKKIIKYKTIIKPLYQSSIIKKKRYSLNKKENIIDKEININNEISNSFISKRAEIKEKLDNKGSILTVVHTNNTHYGDIEPKIQKIQKTPSEFGNKDNINDEVIIDESFIPKCPINFSFDLQNMCFNLEKDNSKSKALKSTLEKEAKEKIHSFQVYLNSFNKNEEEETSESNSDDYTSNSNEDSNLSSNIDKESSYINSSSKSNSSFHKKKKSIKDIKKSISLKDNQKSIIEKLNPIHGSNTLKIIKEVKEDNENIDIKIKDKDKNIINNELNSNSNLSKQIKKYQGKNDMNNYYKVNLSKIHFMIYDFYKDMIVEGNKNEISLKIENIINNNKNNDNILNIGKDEQYPFILFKNNKEEKINKDAKQKNNKLLDEISQNNLISEEKSLARKISNSINNKKDEPKVKTFKLYSLISFITMILCTLLNPIVSIIYYNNIIDIYKVIINIINIKYCNTFSLYLVRELTLLNFNVPNLEGGSYTNFPAKDKAKYESLIKNKLLDLYLENQECLKQILSSDYSPSNNTSIDFYTEYNVRGKFGNISGNALQTLIQNNAIFYNLATSPSPIQQNNPDLFNFINNGITFKNALILLRDIYNFELYIQEKYIIIVYIIMSILVFIIFFIISIFMIFGYISTARRRINYMQVFFGISDISIKNLISNCEKLMNKLKKNEDKNIQEDTEDIEGDISEEKSMIQNKKQNETSRNMTLINNQKTNNKAKLSLNNILFITFYIIFMIWMYIFYPYNGYLLFNISKNSIDYSAFILKMNNFHNNIIEVFNMYREYLFNNSTSFDAIALIEDIRTMESEIFEDISEEVKEIENFISTNIPMDDKLTSVLNKHLCSYIITDYFNSPEECKEKYKNVINYDFTVFASNFMQNLRNVKNIARYKQETENIIGNLKTYTIDLWRNWDIKEISKKAKKETSFRLNLFNDDIIHSNFNVMIINIFIPYLDENRKEIIKRLSLKGKVQYFILNSFLIIFIIGIIYIVYLLPMIRYLNNFIYRTKNMLLFIPMSILTSQSNIKSLLNLT